MNICVCVCTEIIYICIYIWNIYSSLPINEKHHFKSLTNISKATLSFLCELSKRKWWPHPKTHLLTFEFYNLLWSWVALGQLWSKESPGLPSWIRNPPCGRPQDKAFSAEFLRGLLRAASSKEEESVPFLRKSFRYQLMSALGNIPSQGMAEKFHGEACRSHLIQVPKELQSTPFWKHECEVRKIIVKAIFWLLLNNPL